LIRINFSANLQITGKRTRGNGLKLHRGGLGWNRLLREEVESSSPEVFKRHVDVVLTDMV